MHIGLISWPCALADGISCSLRNLLKPLNRLGCIRVKCTQSIQVNCQYRILSLWHMEIHTVVHCLPSDKSQRFKWALLKAITDRLPLGQCTAADFQKFWKNLFNPYRGLCAVIIQWSTSRLCVMVGSFPANSPASQHFLLHTLQCANLNQRWAFVMSVRITQSFS